MAPDFSLATMFDVFETVCNQNIWVNPDSEVHGAIMEPIWGRQDPGGPHVGPMNLAIWELIGPN